MMAPFYLVPNPRNTHLAMRCRPPGNEGPAQRGAGFIGSHVAEALPGCHHEVAIVDDFSSGKRQNIPEVVHLYQMDIRSGCGEVFENFEPDALSHQATQMDVKRSVREPAFDADVNVLGTIGLLQSCVEDGVGKVVFASTGGAIYGE